MRMNLQNVLLSCVLSIVVLDAGAARVYNSETDGPPEYKVDLNQVGDSYPKIRSLQCLRQSRQLYG